MRKFLVLAFAAMVAQVTLTAAPAAAQKATLEKPVVKLGVGSRTQLPYLTLNIADHKGFFKEEGLTVEFNDFPGGGSDSLKALVSGSVEFIAGAYEHTLYMQARGQTITSVALQNNSFGVVIGLSKEKAAAYKSPKDLTGQKIGVTAPGSSSALAVNRALAKDNVAADQVVIVGVGAGNSAVAMMKSGRLDGEANFDPVITRLQGDGDLVPVIDTRTKAGLDYLYGGPFAGSAISTTPDMIKNNPKTMQAFVNAMVKASRWLQKASADDIANALPPDYYAGDRELFKKAVEANREMLSKDGVVTADLAANTYKIISGFNEDVRNAKIDMGKTYDASFAINANKNIPSN